MLRIVFFSIMLLFITCCYNSENKTNSDTLERKDMIVENITAKKAQELVGQQNDLIILDVRTEKEFKEGHIKNAINIDVKEDNFVQKMNELDKTKTYIMHCRSGGRSGHALEMIKDLSFSKMYHMNGGILEWQNHKLPLEK